MHERRRHERTSSTIRVEMTHPSFGTIIGHTTDISDGGAQVVIENHPIPPIGTVVHVIFKKIVGPVNAEPVPMKIMHSHRNVVGMMFVGR